MNARRTFHSGLSAWWRVGVIFTVMAGFAVLIFISVWAYKYSPPIPKKVVNAAGDTVFTGEDILAGQQVFLKYGLMKTAPSGATVPISAPTFRPHIFIPWPRTSAKPWQETLPTLLRHTQALGARSHRTRNPASAEEKSFQPADADLAVHQT